MKINRFFSIFLGIIAIILQFFYIFSVNGSDNIISYAITKTNLTSARAMITMEANTGRVLYKKDENLKLPMASTTKIITAIVAIENCKNLDKKYEIPANSVGIEGSSIYLRKNEHLSIRELLYGLMLRSGNDSAVAIATIVAGSVEKFVLMMNDFCKSLGLSNTNIVTVNGLHNDNHYTTAYDLGIITCYALKNKTFSEIVSTKNITISDENSKEGVRYLKNKNKLLKLVNGADGVKTGFTKKAGRCFVGSATRNGMHIVCVVLDCNKMFEESSHLIEKAFKEFKMYKLFSKGNFFDTQIVFDKKSQTIPVNLKEDVYYSLTTSEMANLKAKIEINNNLNLPLNLSDEIGELKFYLENDLIFSQKLYTINIEKTKEENFFKKILKVFW